MEMLIALLVIILIITPIFAFMAFAGLRRLERAMDPAALQSLIGRIYALERRLTEMEKSVSSGAATQAGPPATTAESLHKDIPATPAPAIAAPPPISPAGAMPREVLPAASVFAAPPLHPSQAKPRTSLDMETLIAGRWLNRIGIVALIASVSYFLKYAFDNNWIGPSGRVAIGILLGTAMLPWSQWLLKSGYAYFSEGIAGLGATVLYLSIWAGWHYYALFSQDVAFCAMIVITAVMAAVALGRDSQRIAVLSLIGGFATPEMVSTGMDAQIVLFTYVLILGAGMLVIAARREWRVLPPIAFLGSQIYFWGWYETFYRAEKLERTILFATLFFLLYAVLPALRAIEARLSIGEDFVVVLANNGLYFSALYVMLWPQDRWALTLFALGLSAAHVMVARMIPPPADKRAPVARFIYAGLALTFATMAIPIRLDGKWITVAFSIEGAILAWSGFRALTPLLRKAGYLLLVIAAMRVLFIQLPARQFLFNERFVGYAVLIACFGAVLYAAAQHEKMIGDAEKNGLGVLAVAVNTYALIALSLELWDYFGRDITRFQFDLAQHLAITVLWTAYATVLILTGVKRESALLRWQALVLFGLVVFKVFLYDSSFLDRFYRILSFFILGVVLLVVSFLYQRKIARGRPSP
jgi:uncharacterized membrane protein